MSAEFFTELTVKGSKKEYLKILEILRNYSQDQRYITRNKTKPFCDGSCSEIISGRKQKQYDEKRDCGYIEDSIYLTMVEFIINFYKCSKIDYTYENVAELIDDIKGIAEEHFEAFGLKIPEDL